MMKRFIIVFIFISINSFFYCWSGDSLTIEEIVVSGKLKTLKLYSPNKVQTINREFISSINSSKLSNILDFADGVFIKDYGYSSGLKTISLNSSQSEHVVIVLNGLKLNSPQNAQIDLGLFELDNIESIEISTGGASALYGSEAVAGMVFLKTYNEVQDKFQFRGLAELGSFGRKKFGGRVSGNILQGLEYYLSYSGESSKNEYEYYFLTPAGRLLRERKNSDYTIKSMFTLLKKNFSQNSSLELTSICSFSKRGVPGPELGYENSSARQDDELITTLLNYRYSFNEFVLMNIQSGHQYSYLRYYNPESAGTSDELDSYFKVNTFDFAGNFALDMKLSSGFSLRHSFIKSNQTENGKMTNLSFFMAVLTGGLSFLKVFPSLRYDYYSHIESKSVFTGKIGINIKPFDKTDISFKSSFGNNFRAPTFNEIFWKGLGNKNLYPEKSISFDAGIYYRFVKDWSLETELSYFLTNTKDRIVWRPESGLVWKPVNISKVKSQGVTFSATLGIAFFRSLGLNFRFSYTNSSSVKTSSDFPNDPAYMKQLIYVPRNMVKSSIMIKYLPVSNFIKSLSLNVFFRYNSERFIDQENRNTLAAFDVTDVNFISELKIYKIITRLKFSVNNLMNEEYEIIAAYPQPLRNYSCEISLNY